MRMLEDAKFKILASCGKDKAISVDTYLRLTASMEREDKNALVQWMGDHDIDVRLGMSMQALYHHEPGRRYRPTRREVDSGKFECPACHIMMVRVTRKAKDPIFRCGDCGWCISRSDIFDPMPGEEPELRTDTEYPEGIAPPPDEAEGPW